MLNIQRNLSNVYSGKQNYELKGKNFGNNYVIADTFAKSGVQSNVSFKAVLKPEEAKQFTEILKTGGEEAKRLLSYLSPREKEVASLRYPVEGEQLSRQAIAARLLITVGNIGVSLNRIGEKFQEYIKIGLSTGETEFAEMLDLPVEKSSKDEIEKILENSSLLNEEEKDILTRYFGLLGHKKETLEEIGKDERYNCYPDSIRRKRDRALANIKKFRLTGELPKVMSGKDRFIEDLGYDVSDSQINEILNASWLDKAEKDSLIDCYDLSGQQREIPEKKLNLTDRRARSYLKEKTLEKIRTYLTTEKILKPKPGEIKFAQAVGLEPDDSLKAKISEIFEVESLLTDKEKDVLKRRFGLFGFAKEKAKEIGASYSDASNARVAIQYIQRDALNKIKNYLSHHKIQKPNSSEIKFANAVGLETNDATKGKIEEIFENDVLLSKEEKDILVSYYGLFEHPAESRSEIAKRYNQKEQIISNHRMCSLKKIQDYMATTLSRDINFGEFEFADDLGLGMNDETRKKIEEIFETPSLLNEKEKYILINFYGLYKHPRNASKKIGSVLGISFWSVLEIKKKAVKKIKNFLLTGNVPEIKSGKEKFFEDLCFEINDRDINKIFADSSPLTKEEKDILMSYYGLLGHPREMLKDIGARYGYIPSNTKDRKDKILAQVRRIFYPRVLPNNS